MNKEFTEELIDLLNEHEVDGKLKTPSFILAKYLVDHLDHLAKTQNKVTERSMGDET